MLGVLNEQVQVQQHRAYHFRRENNFFLISLNQFASIDLVKMKKPIKKKSLMGSWEGL